MNKIVFVFILAFSSAVGRISDNAIRHFGATTLTQ
ncbi:Uncharacterised protein [Candidatus Venteria ishoeyi]|uniref:Uncharacterized protein n=1 Tax=Candidatus Venteria ishoeyi TaxID=1899563 RepID=A0A1H6FCM6_9GAMM|nr:Uncharacterised protein [Candidatus Venteria ishoeyi]